MGSILRILNFKRFHSRYILSIKYGFKLNKPRLLYKIIKNYLSIIILKKQPLRTIDFAPTYNCNMTCEHCFAEVLKDKTKEELVPADYKRIADEADKLGAVHIAFQGGEPMVMKNIYKIIESIDTSRFIVSVTTNGYNTDEVVIKKLKDLDVDMLTISIDSGIAEEHNKFRGLKNAFENAMRAVDLALDNNIGVGINTMVTNTSLYEEGFHKLIEYCNEKKLKLGIILPAMAGKWQKSYSLILSEKDMDYLCDLMQKFPFLRRDLDANYRKWGCGAVKEMTYVTAYGDVLPCAYIHASMGNLKNESLAGIQKRGLQVPEFKEYYPKCLAMEDKDFIEKRLKTTLNKEKLPIAFYEMFPELDTESKKK